MQPRRIAVESRLYATTTSHKPWRFGSRKRLLSFSSKERRLLERMCHLCTPITSWAGNPWIKFVANAVRDKWGRLFYASPETANLKMVLLYLNLISIVSQHAEKALVSDDYRISIVVVALSGCWRRSLTLFKCRLSYITSKVERVTAQTDQYLCKSILY